MQFETEYERLPPASNLREREEFLRGERNSYDFGEIVPGETIAKATRDLDGDLDGWTLSAIFRLSDGEVVHGPITIAPSADARVAFGSLTSSAYRRLSLQPVLVELERAMSAFSARLEAQGIDQRFLPDWIDALKAGRNPGRRGQDPRWYLVWAKRRVLAQSEAPDRPIKWLVEQYGSQGYTEAAINEYVREARRRKLLTPAGKKPALMAQARRMEKT